ncbi:MAG: hypothetical protein AAF221_15580, partial [Pseudomonadota bacterium]
KRVTPTGRIYTHRLQPHDHEWVPRSSRRTTEADVAFGLIATQNTTPATRPNPAAPASTWDPAKNRDDGAWVRRGLNSTR